jgi:hypothetical protein
MSQRRRVRSTYRSSAMTPVVSKLKVTSRCASTQKQVDPAPHPPKERGEANVEKGPCVGFSPRRRNQIPVPVGNEV